MSSVSRTKTVGLITGLTMASTVPPGGEPTDDISLTQILGHKLLGPNASFSVGQSYKDCKRQKMRIVSRLVRIYISLNGATLSARRRITPALPIAITVWQTTCLSHHGRHN